MCMWDAHTMLEALVAACIGNSTLSPLPGLGATAWGLSLYWVCPFLIHLWWVLTFDSSSAFSRNSGSWQGAWLRHHSSPFRGSKTEDCPPNRAYTYGDFSKRICAQWGWIVEKTPTTLSFLWEVLKVLGPVYLWEKFWGVCCVAETQGVFEIAARGQQQISWHPCPASSTHSLPGLCAPEEGLKKVKVSVAQSCLPLCDPVDCSPPGSSVRGISQARILEWVAILPPGDLPDMEIEPGSPTLQAGSLPLGHLESPSFSRTKSKMCNDSFGPFYRREHFLAVLSKPEYHVCCPEFSLLFSKQKTQKILCKFIPTHHGQQ